MSDSEEDTTTESTYKPSFVLIAIDTHPSMFLKGENEFTPFKNCIIACYELADSLIFTQSKRNWSPFGVVLSSEDDSASLINFNNNVLDSIKTLKKKSELSEAQLAAYQRKGNFDLSAFFLFCKKKFKEIQSAFYRRTIIYITNDDDPIKGDQNQRFAVLNEAKNFEANDIEFQVVTFNKNFNYTVFYNELFSVMKVPLVETLIEDKEGLLEKLTSLIIVRYFQRKLNFFPFKGDKSRFLKVIQKKFIQKERLYNNANISSETGKPVKKLSMKDSTAPQNFTLNLDDNANSVEFDLQEHYDLKNNDLPVGYTLLHVSDRVSEIGSILTDSALLEVNYKEDLHFFDSFWQYCVDKNKVLICVRKLKHLDNIRFVEFIPKFANNTRVFIIKTIPFVNEVKNLATKLKVMITDTNSSDNIKTKTTNQLIEALSFDYHPKMFINPSFAKKKAFLRSKLLDEKLEDVEDVTLDNNAIDARLEEVADKFKILFNLEEETGKKRKAPSTAGRAKKSK